MTPYETIRLTASTLAPGESARGQCPWCHGGRGHESSFVVTRTNDSVKYQCFRASCSGISSGVLSLSGDPARMPPVRKREMPRVFSRPTQQLTQENLDYLRERFEFSTLLVRRYGLVETTEGDIIIPIYNSKGLVQGYEARSRRPGVPKALRYNGDMSDGMGWYNVQPDKDELLLVEDLYSAIKASSMTNTLALLGTHLSPEQAGLLAAGQWRKIYLALDEDASAVAVKLAKRYRAMLPQLRVVPLRKDLKDTSYTQLREWYRAVIT